MICFEKVDDEDVVITIAEQRKYGSSISDEKWNKDRVYKIQEWRKELHFFVHRHQEMFELDAKAVDRLLNP